MRKGPLSVSLALVAWLISASLGAEAAPTISVGPYTPASTFVVPIEISGAVDLVSWQFDLAFNPTDWTANSVSEGEFTSSSGAFLTLFIPGVIDNLSGLISLVAGAYLDLPPGPSGSGVLAYVEFSLVNEQGDSPIAVQDESVIQGSSVPAPMPATLALLGSGLALLGGRVLVGRRQSGAR